MKRSINISNIFRQCFALLLCLFVIVEASSLIIDTVVSNLIEIVEFGESNQETEKSEKNAKEDLYSDSKSSSDLGLTSSQVRYYHNIKRSENYQSIPTPPPDLA